VKYLETIGIPKLVESIEAVRGVRRIHVQHRT
jgi:hypothetical protein